MAGVGSGVQGQCSPWGYTKQPQEEGTQGVSVAPQQVSGAACTCAPPSWAQMG